jgi:hypothetical protein
MSDEQPYVKLAWQEFDALNGCVSRGQPPESYQDIIKKLEGHLVSVSEETREYWRAEVRRIGAVVV